VEILLVSAGVACLIAAVAGVAIKAVNIEIGAIASPLRQLLLGLLGVGFLGAGVLGVSGENGTSEGSTTSNEQPSATTTPTQPSATTTPTLPASERLITPVSATATSTLEPQGGITYGVRNLLDNDQTTAWCEGADGNGIGESITFPFSAPILLSRIDVINGYNKGDRYKVNARVQNVEVSATKTRQLATLRDTSGVQRLPVPESATTFVKLTIKSAYAGTRFTDLCLTDVQFIGVRAG
jgi:hypothetical protein